MSQDKRDQKAGSGSRTSARERARAEAAAAGRRGRLMQVLVIGGVAVVVIGIIAAAVIISVVTQGRQTPTADTVVPVGGAQVPFRVEGSTVRLGPADAKVQIELYESYGCTHCKDYDAATASTFEELIAGGDVAVSYHLVHIPTESRYAPLAGNASAAVAAHQPEAWLAFHSALFVNQSAATEGWQAPQLRDFASQQGIAAPEALASIDEGRYTSWIKDNTEQAVKAGYRKTPTLLLNGQPTELLPAEALADRVRQLAGS
ncbi:DsbA family protein [Microlunatus speluncae]|uniref:DsbA family protein n=1 Tax=Microlunatus speluncae TaxID=2594267 RepID=UPI0012665EDB|nr:thioredoxin domain-containing protein [Microlunatus speluncae]